MIRQLVIIVSVLMLNIGFASPEVKTKSLDSKSISKSVVKKRARSEWYKFKREHIPYYKERKTAAGFWVKRVVRLVELFLLISLSTLVAVTLELSGVIRYLGLLLWPFIRLGKLSDHSSAAFFSSFRNGSVGNSMLINARDNGVMSRRQLFTSVLVVSSIATLGHMPSYILAIGAVCGSEAFMAVTLVRVGAVFAQIVVVLLVSGLILAPFSNDQVVSSTPVVDADEKKRASFFKRVFKRSKRTIKRVIIYLTVAYLLVSIGEFLGLFDNLFTALSRYIDLSFLPHEAGLIIPAQFASIHSALATVSSFIEHGNITPKQAVTILLVGSIVTSPIRTLKRIMPTYVALLGAKAGPVMGVAAQVLRMSFLALGIVVMWIVW